MSEAPHTESIDRLDTLRGYYLDIASNTPGLQHDTKEYVRHAGGIRTCLNEIIELEGPTELDIRLSVARADYVAAVLTTPRLRTRGYRARKIAATEHPYIDAIVDKITAVVDATTPQEALNVQQLPTLVEHTSFTEDKPGDAKRLAANHLYLLMDIALKEHVERRAAIDAHRRRGPIVRILGSRGVRAAIAGGIFAASVSPKAGMIPIGSETMTEDLELGVKVLSGAILGIDGPEAIRMQYLGHVHNKRSEQLLDDMAGNQELSDMAFRIIYGSTRIGGSSEHKLFTGRNGSGDKAENLRRFARMDDEFKHLANDTGGKPYTPWQAQGYAARFLIERSGQIQALVAGEKPASERRELYLQLVREIITEDLTRLKKGLSVSSMRKTVMSCVAIVPATFFPNATSLASEATTLSRDATKSLRKKK